MPNKIDDFIPYRLLVYVETQLKEISTALGYNTDPFVTDDFQEMDNSAAKHNLFYISPGNSTPVQGIGQDKLVNQEQTFEIHGSSFYETEDPRMLAMSLEQDVRTALHSNAKEIRSSIGRGCSFNFGSCEYHLVILKASKEAGFRLSVSFTWSQKSDW